MSDDMDMPEEIYATEKHGIDGWLHLNWSRDHNLNKGKNTKYVRADLARPSTDAGDGVDEIIQVAADTLDICVDWNAPSHVEIDVSDNLADLRDPQNDNWLLTRAIARKLRGLLRQPAQSVEDVETVRKASQTGELLPCPFCGAAPELTNPRVYPSARCVTEGCPLRTYAIELGQWKTRRPATEVVSGADITTVRKALEGGLAYQALVADGVGKMPILKARAKSDCEITEQALAALSRLFPAQKEG